MSAFKVLVQEVIQLLLLDQGEGVDLGTEMPESLVQVPKYWLN